MKVTKLFILVVLISLITSCDKAAKFIEKPPESALTGYLDGTINGNWSEAYGFISKQDKAVKSLTEYKMDATEGNELAAVVRSKTSYKILNVEKSGDTATAEVEIMTPDLSGLFADLLKSAFSSALGKGEDSGAMEAEIKEKAESGEFPLRTEKKEFTILNESDGWRVFLDWETEETVTSLVAEAELLREQKKLRAAKAKYDEVLELDSERVDAQNASSNLATEISEFEEKKSYITSIELYDLKARYYETYIDKRVPGVEFKLKNKGNKSLNKVEVTVYFEDSNGNTIAEEDYHPVLVSEYSFQNNKPLKPNYVWQQERGKFYKADSVPSEWKEGAATAKITDIEFADSE